MTCFKCYVPSSNMLSLDQQLEGFIVIKVFTVYDDKEDEK